MTTHQQGSVSPTDVPKAVHGPSVWSAKDVASNQQWLYHLSDAEVSELCKAATRIDKEQLDLCQIDKERFPLPAFAARIALGEMANELLLSSNRVYPSKLMESGYKFLHPELNQALINLK